MTLINEILKQIENELGGGSSLYFQDMVKASPALKRAIKDEQESISQLETKAKFDMECE